jgi:hypothetical protein
MLFYTKLSYQAGKTLKNLPIAALSCNEFAKRVPSDALHKVSVIGKGADGFPCSKVRGEFRKSGLCSSPLATSHTRAWLSIDPVRRKRASGDHVMS